MAQAKLNGIILDDGGSPTCEFRFQYGQTIALGAVTPWRGGLFQTGDTFSEVITGLAGQTRYYFRAECRNIMGVGVGSILSFMTLTPAMPSVGILTPIEITETSALLRGVVIFDGDKSGMVRFHYGASKDYGMVTGYQMGFVTGDEFQATVRGLSPGGAYHCRAEFRNNPAAFSGDMSFSTLSEVGGLVLADAELLHKVMEG